MTIPNLCFTKYGNDWIAVTEIQGETYAFTLSSLDYSLRVQYGRANDDTYTNGTIDMNSTTVRATFTGVALAIGVFTMRFLLDTSCCGSSSSSSSSTSHSSSASASHSSASSTSSSMGTDPGGGADCFSANYINIPGITAFAVPVGNIRWYAYGQTHAPGLTTYTHTCDGGATITIYSLCGGSAVGGPSNPASAVESIGFVKVDNTAGSSPVTFVAVTES